MSDVQSYANEPSKKKGELIWANIIFFGLSFLAAVTLVPWYGMEYGYHWSTWMWGIGLWLFSSTSISMGYHRLWSHRAYEANAFLRGLLAFGGCLALQNSALHWSSDHRMHHKHVDHDEKDPYSASLGFWHSHIGWILKRRDNGRYNEQYDRCPDLKRQKIVMFQHKYYWVLSIGLNVAVPALLGLAYGHFWEMMLVAGVFRLVWSHHLTFFINSLAHIWGSRPYTEENSARDNFILAVLTGGEGYHNYHHKFQLDYRNGIRWWHFDPSKWWIKSLSWIGVTKNLKVAPAHKIERAKAETLLLKAKEKTAHLPNAEEIMQKLHDEYDQLVAHMAEFYEAKKAWIESKKADLAHEIAEEKAHLIENYEQFKLKLEEQKLNWMKLARQYA
ncbi:acyl-CoA desaturase [Kangiella sediminilitoris]|uniref:Acyl-CoA desaturase n=1 Tax=Kangiella sediminilitoris TaxID=1144748 RepID=A0A1B3BAZ4_9GAMM|nr:fatty acid desaturase [Kangiella sediminilitoris]AOE49969.1 acyl-CoA desaturase [Kangiella sediminilitoris]